MPEPKPTRPSPATPRPVPSPPSLPPSPLPAAGFPWGQVALTLLGLGLLLKGIEDLLRLAGADPGEALALLSGLLILPALVCGLVAVWRSQRLRRQGERLPHVPWLRTANVLIYSGMLILLLLSLLLPAFQAGGAAARQAALSANSADWKTVSTADGRWALEVPGSWLDCRAELGGFQGIAQRDPGDLIAVTALSEPREDLAISSLDEYVKVLLQQVRQEFPQAQFQEERSAVTGNQRVREWRVSTVLETQRMNYLLQFFETPQEFVVLRAWGAPSHLRDREPLVRQIFSSYRQQDPPRR